MAWRIHDSVKRGEIDNRERGIVRGRLWLDGYAEPLVLELQGNACPDLAGCLLTFENAGKTLPMRQDADMNPEQRGTIGDLTASRKVRVFDIPFDEAYERLKQKLPVPEHMANCLYLEWFSEANGRVVVESTDYRLTVSAPAWTLTPAEEEQRAREAAAGFTGFMTKVSEALESARPQPAEDKAWDEFDSEKLLPEGDRRTDKYMELLDQYMDHPDRERIIAREMGWEREDENDDDNGDDDESSGPAPGVEERNRIAAEAEADPLQPDPATEGRDWVRDEDGNIHHPLQLRIFHSTIALMRLSDGLGESRANDKDLRAFVEEFQLTGCDLAGALNGLVAHGHGRDLRAAAFIVHCLKRALDPLHASQAALERVAARQLLPEETLVTYRRELFEIREEILRLMDEFRGRS